MRLFKKFIMNQINLVVIQVTLSMKLMLLVTSHNKKKTALFIHHSLLYISIYLFRLAVKF